MQLPTYIINTFTSPSLKGNPTAVCYLRSDVNDETLQSLAKELYFPVTAFLRKSATPGEYGIKYFTPTTEIPACGHATLAAAKVAQLEDKIESPAFHTIDRIIIKTSFQNDAVIMAYPKYDMEEISIAEEMLDSLHLKDFKNAGFCAQLETIFIELEDAAILKTVQPDFQQLMRSNSITKEVVLTSVSDNSDYDFLLRSFCPWIGIDEDPVTGSVHSVLAGFWSNRLNKKLLKACQASERGGEILVRSYDDKVEIGGRMTVVQTPLQFR